MLKLKDLRTEKNILQKDLAKIVNKSTVCVGDWERGRVEPSIEDLTKLANYFDTSIDYLVGRTDEFELVKNENSLSKNESELLSLFKKLDTIKQNKVIGYCYALAN